MSNENKFIEAAKSLIKSCEGEPKAGVAILISGIIMEALLVKKVFSEEEFDVLQDKILFIINQIFGYEGKNHE